MSLVQWTDAFSVKVKEIDGQHKKLIELINTLHDAMQERRSKEVIGGILVDLANYTDTHFATEEKYFDKFGYPDTAAHKKQHQDFIKKVGEYIDQFDKGNLVLSIDIMNFLLNWLKNHIKNSDLAYSEFFNSKGLR